jgi:hypothetical protein
MTILKGKDLYAVASWFMLKYCPVSYHCFLLVVYCNREKTFRSMMYHLLTGPCGQLASNRVIAIKEVRSVSTYFESLADGSEDKESVKEKIDLELKSAVDAGLNFNVSYNLRESFSLHHLHFSLWLTLSYCKIE